MNTPPTPPFVDPDKNAEKLFAGPCTFLRGVAALTQLPDADLPEVAFIGRSNVGKSSLLNALTNRRFGAAALARVSNTPGRTQQLNFFDLGGLLWLVDLPGYGYAEAPKKQVEEWNLLIRDYLRGRQTLRRAYLLADSRHGLKANDIAFMKLLNEAAVSTQVILTKTDLVKPTALAATVEATRLALKKQPAALPEPLCVSSEKGEGLEAIRADVAAFANL